MKNILAIGGSNSKTSINKALATYVANQLEQVTVNVLDFNQFVLPIYGIDFENEKGIPTAAKEMDTLLAAADGIVISLAEHNGSYAAVFKNAFDWLSRIDKSVWKQKPMFLMATSPGKRGGMTVLQAAKTSFPHLGANIIADFSLPSFYENFSEKGLKDESLQEQLNQKIAAFNGAL